MSEVVKAFWDKLRQRDENLCAAFYIENGAVVSKSYAELLRDVDDACRYFRENEISGRIGLSGVLSYKLIVAFLAIESMEYTAVCVPPIQSNSELPLILGMLGVRDIITDTNSDKNHICEKDIIHLTNTSDCVRIPGEGVILLTSGTTGRSKPVVLSFEGMILDEIYSARRMKHIVTCERFYSILPMYHAFCITAFILSGLIEGNTICLGANPQKMIEEIKTYKAEVLFAVPQMVKAMNSFFRIMKTETAGELKYIVVGGAALDEKLFDDMLNRNIVCLEGYGITECSPIISVNSSENYKRGSVGKPFSELDFRIKDGEIQVKGSTVFLDYALDGKAKETVMEDGFYKTGDTGYLDDDGFLFVTGRIKDTIVLATGENVSPTALEEKLMQIPEIADAFVYEKKVGASGVITAAVYVRNLGNLPAEKADEIIADKIRNMEGLMPHERIARLEISDRPLQRTALGKIKRVQEYEVISERSI